jgi:hypothetical protein
MKDDTYREHECLMERAVRSFMKGYRKGGHGLSVLEPIVERAFRAGYKAALKMSALGGDK